MAFSQSTISDVQVRRAGAELAVSWTSTAPAGTTFQVYLAGELAWAGTSRSCLLPWPPDRGGVDVGAVDASEKLADFSGSLTPANDRATIAWSGGTFLSPTIAGFRVYAGIVAGGPVDFASPVATVAAYPGGIVNDGFGLGRFGKGGFGLAESEYAWRSRPLANGTWSFSVAPFDRAGNELPSPGTVTQTIAAPPHPPAPDPRGVRLQYVFNSGPKTVTLSWLPSPG